MEAVDRVASSRLAEPPRIEAAHSGCDTLSAFENGVKNGEIGKSLLRVDSQRSGLPGNPILGTPEEQGGPAYLCCDFENALSEHGLLKSPDTEERQSEFESLFILAREMSLEIKTVKAGKQRVGYYSEQYICEMLAMLLAWKEQDPLVLMAEIVRFNSFHNPRLTVKSLFMKLPFQLSPKEVEATRNHER